MSTLAIVVGLWLMFSLGFVAGCMWAAAWRNDGQRFRS